jgi:hypothetical protein
MATGTGSDSESESDSATLPEASISVSDSRGNHVSVKKDNHRRVQSRGFLRVQVQKVVTRSDLESNIVFLCVQNNKISPHLSLLL